MTEYLTLAEYAADPKPLVAGVAKILREDSPFMDQLRFVNVGALAIKVIREGGMPSISWRKAGASHGSAKGTTPTEVTEQAFSFGNMVDVDKVYMKDKSPRLYDPRTYWTAMTVKAMAREFNDAAINGDPTVNPDRPTGLFYRIRNHFSGQDIDAGSGSGLDISPDATGLSANIQTLLDKLDKLIYACEGHSADFLLMNDTLKLRLWSALRQSGLLKTTTDNLGREWGEYKGAKFIDMGFKVDDSTKIITDVETVDGTALTGGSATSIYAVKQGPEYFTAWQEYGMEVEEKGYLDDGVTHRTIIDWVIGLAVSNPRSIARLHGIIAA